MEKKIQHTERRGLPGGPNEMFTYVTSVFDIYQAPSNIEGQGMFAGKPFKKGDLIGLAHSNDQAASQLGRMHNHDENSPTMISKKSGNDRFVFAAKDLQPGDELTTNYRMQPELEQPDQFQNGGSVMVSPRQGVRKNPDGTESTHLMATETLDGKNWVSFPTLFQDPDGTWIDMSDKPWKEAYEEAKKRGELIDFGTDKETAIKFGEGSWKPKMKRGGALLDKTIKCGNCGWEWKAADGGSDIMDCHKCGGKGLLKAQQGKETKPLPSYEEGGEGGDETAGQDNFLKNWFTNRKMPTPEGQKLLEKVRPEAIERASQNVPYVMSNELPKNVAGYYDTEDKNIYLNQAYPAEQINSTKEHERVHYVQDGDKFYKTLDSPHKYLVEENIKEPKEINTGNPEWDKNVKENYDEIVPQEEIHARIMTLRRLAGFKPDQVITEEMLNNYFNSVEESGESLDPDIEDLKAVTKGNSSIINLLNDMVSAPQKEDTMLYAQKGGEKEDTSWTAYFNPANWGTSRYDDKATFKEAFRAARNEGDSDFLWKGTRYTTELKAAPTTTTSTKPAAPKGITPELLVRQAYRESTFNPKAVSPAGYKGLGQIGDQVIKDYKKANNITGTIDPFNMKQNSDVHKYSMNELYNSSFINKPGQSEEVRLAKTLAAYNWGRGNVINLLNDLKEDGVDIYNSLDWVDKLPKESRNYINDILLQKNTTFNTDFSKALSNQKNKPITKLYGFRNGGESKLGPLMKAYNRLPMEKKMGGAISNKKEFGGQLNSGNITMYKDYVKGNIGNEEQAVKNYDKLNRIHYSKAKELGMTAANYIMTYIVGNS